MLFWLMTLRKKPPRPATDSHALRMNVEVQHCRPPLWALQCPTRWARMLATGDERVRVCGTCGQDVTLCLSQQEACALVQTSPTAMMACAPEHFVGEVCVHRDLRREQERVAEARELRRKQSRPTAPGGT